MYTKQPKKVSLKQPEQMYKFYKNIGPEKRQLKSDGIDRLHLGFVWKNEILLYDWDQDVLNIFCENIYL